MDLLTVMGQRRFDTLWHEAQNEFPVGREDAVGNGVADDTHAIQRAIDKANAAGGGIVTSKPGLTHNVLSLALKSNVTLDLRHVTLLKNGGGTTSHIIDATGSLGTASALTVNAALGDESVTVTSGSAFAAGQIALLRSTVYVNIATSQGRDQEFVRVKSVVGNVVTFQDPIFRAYATADAAELVVANVVRNARILGGTATIPTGTAGGCLYSDLAYDLDIDGLTCGGSKADAAFYLTRTAHTTYRRCHAEDGQSPGALGLGNGWEIDESSHHIKVIDCSSRNVSEGAIENNCYYIEVENYTDTGAYSTAWNTHGAGSKHIAFRHVTSILARGPAFAVGFNSHTAGDENVTFSDCEAWYPAAHGLSIVAPSTKRNQHITVQGLRVYGPGRVTASSAGVVVQESDDVLLQGVKVYGANNTNLASAMLIQNTTDTRVVGGTFRDVSNGYGVQFSGCTNLRIDDNDFTNISSYNIRNFNAAASSNGLITRNRTDDNLNLFVVGQSSRDGSNTFDVVRSMSADRGDNSVTVVVGVDEETQYFNTPLTSSRSVTLNAVTGVYSGATFRIVRAAGATGALSINVGIGPLKALTTAGTWCEVAWYGAAWVLIAAGSL